MKKFLVKGIIFALIIVIIAELFNWLYIKSDPLEVNKFHNVPDSIYLCNIGASHSLYGFNYEDVSRQYTTFNFGLPAQSHYYDRNILEYYKDNLAKGSIVFITVSYPMLFGLDETHNADFASKNLRYYFFLPKNYIREYNFLTDIKCMLVPFSCSTNFGDILAGILSKDKKSDEWKQGITPEKASVSAKNALINHTVTNKVDENGKIIHSDEAVRSICDMIVMCKDIGVTPVLVTPPFTNEYNSIIKEKATEFYNEFYKIIKEIQAYTGVSYYNYSEDVRFEDNYDLFLDADHLSKEGARLFTDILIEEIATDLLNFE